MSNQAEKQHCGVKLSIFRTLVICFLCMFSFTSLLHANEIVRLSEPTSTNAYSETFGSSLDSSLPKVTLVKLMEEANQHLDQSFQIETKVAKVCQKKGCFFIAQQDDVFVRVSFKDYAFFIPTDSVNKTVLLNGKLISKTRSDEQAAHFNSDLKMNNVLQSGDVYEIVASSIEIPLSN